MTKAKLILFIAVVLALFTRGYQYKERFAYDHDTDLSSWIVKDVVVDRHHRLIGQLTSAPGVFIGSLFYYSLIPFYLVDDLDPFNIVYYSWIIGVLGVLSIYFVVSRIHGTKAGLISSFIYALSFGLSTTERQVVPTIGIFLWSIWFYFAIYRLFEGNKRSLILHAILFSLAWHIQFNLVILAVLVIIGILKNIRKFKVTDFFIPILVFTIMSLPLIMFEVRHNFSQTNALFGSVHGAEAVKRAPQEKLTHVIEYVSRNVNYNFYEKPERVPTFLLTGLLTIATFYLLISRRLPVKSGFIFLSWFALFITLFVIHPINLSEYYLNALNVIWFIIASVILAQFSSYLVIVPLVVMLIFGGHNLSRVLNSNVNKNGYFQKIHLIEAIKSDATSRGYPCIAVSYIVNPGYDLGYRFLLWRAGLKTAAVSTNAPVYSIVFPLSRVDSFDMSFGALGLVLPDYGKYTDQSVAQSCAGDDYNTTYPMFGFTK